MKASAAQKTELLTQAQRMSALGARLFPLRPRSKLPWTEHGFLDAKPFADVEKALTNPGTTSYGLAFLDDPDDQFPVFALDLDGEGWRERWAALEERLGKLPPTLRVTTPHGGHIYLRWDRLDGPLPAGNKLFGFLYRAPAKGYLVGPGSETEDGFYKAFGDEIALMPEAWIAEALKTTKKTNGHADTVTMTVAGPGYELPESIPEGMRYPSVVEYVASRYNLGASKELIWGGVLTELRPLFEVDLPDEKLRDRFERSWKGIAERLGPPAATKRRGPVLSVPERQQKALEKGAYTPTAFAAYPHSEVNWLWDDWLPRGVVTLLDGNPGEGKSNIAIDLIARMSRGDIWPDGAPGSGAPQTTLYITREDDPSTTLGPRLAAAGGDLSRAFFLDAEFILPDDALRLRDLILSQKPDLVIIDPLFSHVGEDVKTAVDTSVRVNVMNPLMEIAHAGDCAMLILRHYNKQDGSSALNRGSGSLGGISGAARQVLGVTSDPDDVEEGRRRVFGPIKSSYALTNHALKYEIVGVPLEGFRKTISKVEWLGASKLSVNDILSDQSPERSAAAAERLMAILEAGPLKPTEVLATMKAGRPTYGRAATYTAARRLNVVMQRQGYQGGAVWYLPGHGEVAIRAKASAEPARAERGPRDVHSSQAAPYMDPDGMNGTDEPWWSKD